MADVTDGGQWLNHQIRLIKEVVKGFTPFQEGDVLFAKITPCMENGKGAHAVGLINGVGFGTTEFHVLRAKERVSSRYLYHLSMFDLLRKKAEAQMTGSAGQQRVPADFFDKYQAPFFQLDEQIQIARILDTIDEVIQRTEQLIAKLKAIKQGLLHDLLTRGLDENGQLRDPIAHPEQFKDSPLGRIPKEWEITQIKNVCSLLNGFAFKPDDWGDRGLPIIRIQNLNGGVEFNYYHKPIADDYIIPPGTLLFSWSGNRGTSFGPYIWEGPMGVLNQHIFKVTPKQGIRLKWLYYAFDEIRQRAERAAHGGSGLVHVRREDLQKYLLPKPDEAEQERIEKILESKDSNLQTEEHYLLKLKLLKKGLMHDLLTGKVRVNIGKDNCDEVKEGESL
jgi:type I restriction enzyme S subunit